MSLLVRIILAILVVILVIKLIAGIIGLMLGVGLALLIFVGARKLLAGGSKTDRIER